MRNLTTESLVHIAGHGAEAGETLKLTNLASRFIRFGVARAARSMAFALLWTCATSLLPPQVSTELKLQTLSSVALAVVAAFGAQSFTDSDVSDARTIGHNSHENSR